MKKIMFVLMIFATTLLLFTSFAFATVGDVLLKEEKSDVIVTVEIPSLDVIFKYIENIAKQIGQEGSELKNEMAKAIFKVSDPKMILTAKPVEIIVLNPKKYPVPVIMTFSVSDKDKFLASFGDEDMTLNEKTKDAKIREYTKTETEFDNDAYMRDLEAGKEINFEDYNKEVTKTYFLSVVDNIAVASGDMALMEKALVALGKKIETKRIITGDIQGIVNIESVMTIYADEISKASEDIPIPPDSNAPFDVGKLLKLYIDSFISLGKSIDNMQFSATALDKGDLGMQFAMVPKADSWLSKIIVNQEPKPFSYLVFLPEDASFVSAWNINFNEDFANIYVELVQQVMEIMTKGAMNDEDKTKMTDLIRQNFKALGQGGAMSMAMSRDGLDMRGIAEIKDKALAIKTIKEGLAFAMEKWVKPFMQGKEDALKIQYVEGKEPYKGATLDSIIIDVKTDEISAEEKDLLKKFWGDSMAVHLGYTDKAAVFSMGSKGIETAKQILDSISAPPTKNVMTSPGFISATAGFPKDGLFIMYISVGNFFKGAMEAFGDEGMPPGGNIMIQMFEKINFAAYATKKENAMIFGTKIPVSDFISMYGQLMMGPPMEDEEEDMIDE